MDAILRPQICQCHCGDEKNWTQFKTKRFRNLFCSHWDSAWCMSPMKLQMKTWSCLSMPYRFKLKLCFQQLCNTAVSGPGLTKLKIFKPFSNQSIPHFRSFGKLLPIPSCPNPFNLGWLRQTPIIASGVPQDSHHLRFAKCFVVTLKTKLSRHPHVQRCAQKPAFCEQTKCWKTLLIRLLY